MGISDEEISSIKLSQILAGLWGFSGHIQTILQGVISRLSCPLVDGRRHFTKAADGATVSYDLYQSMGRSSGKIFKTPHKILFGSIYKTRYKIKYYQP